MRLISDVLASLAAPSLLKSSMSATDKENNSLKADIFAQGLLEHISKEETSLQQINSLYFCILMNVSQPKYFSHKDFLTKQVV